MNLTVELILWGQIHKDFFVWSGLITSLHKFWSILCFGCFVSVHQFSVHSMQVEVCKGCCRLDNLWRIFIPFVSTHYHLQDSKACKTVLCSCSELRFVCRDRVYRIWWRQVIVHLTSAESVPQSNSVISIFGPFRTNLQCYRAFDGKESSKPVSGKLQLKIFHSRNWWQRYISRCLHDSKTLVSFRDFTPVAMQHLKCCPGLLTLTAENWTVW